MMIFYFDAKTRVARPLAGGKVCFLGIFVILLEHSISAHQLYGSGLGE